MSSHQTGCVFLIGAGPGEPGYLTLRGAECLALADVILYDYLVNPAILRHARDEAELVCLGHHGHTRVWSQEEINAEVVRLASQGKSVARLKSGDPTIFARVAEELETLLSAGIPFEMVPGVTAAAAAGSCAGIPLTHRDFASAVAFVTGHEECGKADSALDYAALAQFPGTLVMYMGVTTVRAWTSELIAAGKPPETPCGIVRRCSFPDQHTIHCRLDEVAQRMTEPEKLRPPVIVIVGEVTKLAQRYSWFDRRPLFGKRILVTRPREQCEVLAQPLRKLGADVLLQPAIRIVPPEDWSAIDGAIGRLSQFEGIAFSSSNGVRFFFDRLLALGRDARSLATCKMAAIGPGTAEELQRYSLRADLMPRAEFRAESLAQELIQRGFARGQNWLLIRASRGRETLPEELCQAGAKVEQVVAYRSEDVTTPDQHVQELLASGKIDWITVTSSAIARSLVHLFGDRLRQAKLASISPLTTQTLRDLGYHAAVEAGIYTMPGVVAAILGGEGHQS